MYYKNKIHQKIFEKKVIGNPCKCPNEYLATLYLLAADQELWMVSKRKIGSKSIDFDEIRPRNFTTNRYTLFLVAKDIYTGEMHITFQDLCNRYLVPDTLFELFITAIHIQRLGYPYIGIEKAFT